MDTEKALAGILLQRPEIFPEILGTVFVDDFVDSRAARVFLLAEESFREGIALDLVIAGAKMKEHAAWIAEAYDTIPINYKQYAEHINTEARTRRIIAGVKLIVSLKESNPDELLHQVGKIHQDESKVSSKRGDINGVISRTRELINKNRRRGEMHGISTGFSFLDDLYVRYIPGHMWVVTGFTSTGKSTLLTEMLGRIANSKTVLVSTEMTEEQMVGRMVSRETGYHNQVVLSGRLAPQDADRADTVMNVISKRNFVLFDDVLDIAEIESVITQRAMSSGVDVVFIDYVQQMTCKGTPRKEWGAEMANRIQQLAKRANTCIVCMSQVSNQVGRGDVEQFEAKGAGEWAASCDVGVRLKRSKTDKYKLIFDMQKGRHFGTTTKELQFMSNFTRISE